MEEQNNITPSETIPKSYRKTLKKKRGQLDSRNT